MSAALRLEDIENMSDHYAQRVGIPDTVLVNPRHYRDIYTSAEINNRLREASRRLNWRETLSPGDAVTINDSAGDSRVGIVDDNGQLMSIGYNTNYEYNQNDIVAIHGSNISNDDIGQPINMSFSSSSIHVDSFAHQSQIEELKDEIQALKDEINELKMLLLDN